MKKLFLFLLTFTLPVFAQTFSGQSGDTIRVVPPFRSCLGPDNGTDACFIQGGTGIARLDTGKLDFQMRNATVAGLPSAVLNSGRIYVVTDASTAGSCTVGGGTALALCRSSGSVWQSIGDGVGGGGGGNINPGTTFNQTTVWNAGSSLWVPHAKPSYDISDPAWGFVCDGATYNTSAATTLVNSIAGAQANVQIPQPNHCGIGDFLFPANITLDFAPGGTLKLLTDSTTTPGLAAYDSTAGATGNCKSDNTTPACAMAVTAVANDTYALVCMRGFSSGVPVSALSTNNTDIIIAFPGTATTQTSINVGWIVPNVTSGARTFTVTFTNNLVGACSAIPISGLGPTPWLDGNGNNAAGINTPMSSGAATLLSGSFLLAFGGNNNTAETCTAGAGFTLIPGAAGCSTNTNSNLGVEYQNSSSAGSTTATMTISPSPAGHNWAFQMIGLRPGSARVFVLGGINNPANAPIFENATGTAGVVDFTGNLVPFDVMPEWWGASSLASASTNLAALQASEHGAYGTNRINGSGLNQYNKNWVLSQNYHINGELQLYNVMGVPPGARAQMICKGGGGLTQDAVNKRILDRQSTSYFDIHDCSFTAGASQDATHPLVDDDFDGVTVPSGSPPQLETCYNCTFNGNNQAAIGLLGAKSGSGAQYSNEYCVDCEMLGFSQACWQVGTPSSFAQNALAIGYSGDMQSCPGNGFAVYGGGYVSISAGSNGLSTMENGFTTQTGYDILGVGTQGPCIVEHFRSESRKFASCPTLRAKDVLVINQALFPTPGVTFPVGSIMNGDFVTSDGAGYKVTVNASPFSGAGTPSAPLIASSGSGTTLADTNNSIAGSVTIGTFLLSETVTQAVTGSSGTITVVPSSFSTITGTLTSGTFQNAETVTQATTGITAKFFGTGTATAMFVQNLSGTADNSHTWTGGTSGATFNPSTAPAASVASPSLVISSPTGSPDNSHNWTGGTSSAVYVPTGAPVPQAAWTVNAFTGMLVGVLGGTNALCYGVITSNAATSVTLSAGWLTKYPFTPCSAPDATSTFLIGFNPNHGTVTDGGMTMVYQNENTIQGGAAAGMQGSLEDVNVPLGQVYVSGGPTSRTSIKNLTVSRADWYVSSGGNDPQSGFADRDWDVNVFLLGGSKPINWAYPAITGIPYNGALHRDLGAKVVCWSAGTISLGAPSPANTSANDVCIGGRSDLGASTTASRNILEFTGMLGRAAPSPNAGNSYNATDANGTDTDITGGPSTGAGTGGAINFYTSVPSGSSANPNSGAKRARINTSGQIESLLTTGTAPLAVASITPVANLTLSNHPQVQACGATSTCSHTAMTGGQIVEGSAPLVSGSPSTVTITGISPAFTSTSSYNCTASEGTAASALFVTKVSGSSITITGPNTVTDTVSFICAGN